MQKDLINIIVPIYNSKKYIERCVDSILNQTYQNFELILINDGSTDNSLNVINKYKNNSKIKIIDKKNEGVAKTRNLGIDMSKGKYIMFIDNDDYIDSDYIYNYYNAIENNDMDVVFGSYKCVSQNGKTSKITNYKSNKILSKYFTFAPWAKIYNLGCIKKNKIYFLDSQIGEDVYFNLKVYGITSKVLEIDYNGYNWYHNEKSISRSKQNKISKDINPFILLDRIIKECNFESKEIKDYIFTKYIIWYLLYASKKSKSDIINRVYKRSINWLNKNDIEYKSNMYLKKSHKHGESFKTSIILKISLLLIKMNLFNKFLIVYSKIL